MKINWTVRRNNMMFLIQVAAAVFLPILAYFGLKWEDMTSWGSILGVLGEAVKNPVVFFPAALSVFNAITDPTTKGIGDSTAAQAYVKPK